MPCTQWTVESLTLSLTLDVWIVSLSVSEATFRDPYPPNLTPLRSSCVFIQWIHFLHLFATTSLHCNTFSQEIEIDLISASLHICICLHSMVQLLYCRLLNCLFNLSFVFLLKLFIFFQNAKFLELSNLHYNVIPWQSYFNLLLSIGSIDMHGPSTVYRYAWPIHCTPDPLAMTSPVVRWRNSRPASSVWCIARMGS